MRLPVDPAAFVILRVFLAFESLIFGVIAVAYLGHDSPDHAPLAAAAMLGMALLGATYVNIRSVRRWTEQRALLALLVWVAMIPTVGQVLALYRNPAAWSKLMLEMSLLSMVPLILIAWQSLFRVAAGIVALVAVADCICAAIGTATVQDLEKQLHIVVARTIGLLVATFVVARLASAQRLQHDILQQAHLALTRYATSLERLTVSRERNRIARELHDTLAHSLSSIAVQLEATRWLDSSEPQRFSQSIERCLQTARSGLTEVRRAMQELRATPLESLGLVLAIRSMAESMAERLGGTLTCHFDADVESLAESIEQCVFRIAQEALENVERHSGAKTVNVLLETTDGWLRFVVEDDGRGFDIEDIARDRHGVRGMQERAELLSGDLRLVSQPGKGTRVAFDVALAAPPAQGLEQGNR